MSQTLIRTKVKFESFVAHIDDGQERRVLTFSALTQTEAGSSLQCCAIGTLQLASMVETDWMQFKLGEEYYLDLWKPA
jgi:hypothetical protein